MTEDHDLYTALAVLTDDELARLDNGLADDDALETTDEDYRLVAIEQHTLMRVKLLARSVGRSPIQVPGKLAEHAIDAHDVALNRGSRRGDRRDRGFDHSRTVTPVDAWYSTSTTRFERISASSSVMSSCSTASRSAGSIA